MPERIAYLWTWFAELRNGAGEGFSGPAPVTHETVAAWRENFGYAPSPAEIRLLMQADVAWRAECRRLHELKRPKKPKG